MTSADTGSDEHLAGAEQKSTEISIRRAGSGDAATVHRLIRALADHQGHIDAATVTTADLAEMLDRPEITYLIAERDGRPVGYVSWLERISFWSGDNYLALDDLFVVEAERGRGVGEQLMRAAAETSGGKAIRWEVGEANAGARRFYERIGAKLISKQICRWQPT